MKKDNFIEILNRPEINKAAVALKMYPTAPTSAKNKLANKVNEIVAGSGKQRLLDTDLEIGAKVLKDLADDIYARLDLVEPTPQSVSSLL
jgi:hypothetical protein